LLISGKVPKLKIMDDAQNTPPTVPDLSPEKTSHIPDTSVIDIKTSKPNFHPYFQKLFLPFLAVLTLVTGLGVSLQLIGQRQSTETQASVDKVDLILSAPTTVNPNQEFSVTVGINTQTYKVTAVQLDLTYQTDKYDYVSLTASDFLPSVLTPATGTNGIASIVLGSGTTAKQGNGTLAVLTLRAKPSSGVTQIGFASSTAVAGIDSANQAVPTSVLGDAHATTITISGTANETTPTPTPTPTATPTVSSNPTPTPNPSITPTPNSGGGEPNSCGGTCGTHANCKVGLFCNSGICRNPSCSTDGDCVCTGTAVPTATPTTTPTPTSAGTTTATPTPLAMIQATPSTNTTAPLLTKPGVPTDLNFTYVEPTPTPRPGFLGSISNFFSNLFKALFGNR
jgi:hypothetical protein